MVNGTNFKRDVNQFCVFGNVAWAHSPYEKRKDLQLRYKKCIFVGYFKDIKGYRLLQSHTNEIIIRRHVKFDENLLYCEPNSIVIPSSTRAPS